VCLHGHFYQPPREDPWTGRIERQPSAAPFHDWNRRVSAECYAPNAAARVLGPEGELAARVNNYERISFDFGPTLLAWMEEAEPETYRAILEADRVSRRRFGGHGNAIAQAHGHLILPLARRRDKVTQVRWGLADFEHRFGRPAEGLWLPETAADTETLEVLATEGVSFTVLAPRQAARVRRLGPGGEAETDWLEVDGEGVDPRHPYLCRLPSGKRLSLFFYHGALSREVAFGDLLRRGERFAGALVSRFADRPGPQLVHVATDGETYGHHHRFGDMALGWALELLDRSPAARGIELTNYGQYLEHHPPEWQVEIVEGSSWSCEHGVERWRDACGCRTGGEPGWRQEWRRPLREALDWLRDELDVRSGQVTGELLADPWAARDDDVARRLDPSPEAFGGFLVRHRRRELAPEERERVRRWLELQRHAQAMFTSCGWFFNDLAGIETVQVLRYAARALELSRELFGEDLEPGFLERLAPARSNRAEEGEAARLWRRRVTRTR
jgi:alpha-amylase/alpha-mannosidase (GH57 family)